MSSISFENYNAISNLTSVNNTEASGRYAFQEVAEKSILQDVINKLDLKTTDSLLEIGCGPGNLLIPLSYFCTRAVGIDNIGAVTRLNERLSNNPNVSVISGNFFNINLPVRQFEKVLIYSVLQYMGSKEEVFDFVGRALSMLKPGGRMLVGDLPNVSKKFRFGRSAAGKYMAEKWANQIGLAGGHPLENMEQDGKLVKINDSLILELLGYIRNSDYEAFLYPQHVILPFGGSREDILVIAHD